MWGRHCSFTHKTLWIATIFPHMFFFSFFCVFFFVMIFSKIIFVDFIFLILSWLEFSFVIFFKTLWVATVFPYMVFFYDFFQNFLCWFYFFNIELVENYNYNKAKIMWEKHYSFPNKTLGLLQYLPTRFFFSYDFFKIVFVDFFF